MLKCASSRSILRSSTLSRSSTVLLPPLLVEGAGDARLPMTVLAVEEEEEGPHQVVASSLDRPAPTSAQHQQARRHPSKWV